MTDSFNDYSSLIVKNFRYLLVDAYRSQLGRGIWVISQPASKTTTNSHSLYLREYFYNVPDGKLALVESSQSPEISGILDFSASRSQSAITR